ncbi:MAG TPA: hypothetical protein VEZ12_19865, partial [Herpetosiphonaceae bacterium]|nr:hypothetical protein [Herpetosiphonaceae bacterium]
YMYNLYIGWIPVVLAFLSLPGGWRHARREILFLGSGACLMFVLASALPLRPLDDLLPVAANIRHTPLMAGLAVPALLGLAAAGLDRLLTLPWPRIVLPAARTSGRPGLVVRPVWLLGILLLWSLWTPARLAQHWLRTMDARPLYTAMAALRTPGPAWVAPPYGELRWTQAGLDLGLKLSPIVWVFTWHDVPMPYLEAVPKDSPPAFLRLGPWAGLPLLNPMEARNAAGIQSERAGTLGEVPIYRYSGQHYAAVITSMQAFPCQAGGSGGDLTITCTNEQAGELVVQEHTWSGWSGRRDGVPVPLKAGPWLRVAAPAGLHTYELRYRPWDVLLGFASTVLGATLTCVLWIRTRTRSWDNIP